MSFFAVTEQTRMAAARCGADAEVWAAAHALHLSRSQVAVITHSASIGGVIVGLSDEGVTVGYGPEIGWGEIRSVTAL